MNIIKHLIKSDKTPVYILTLSAVIGAVVSLIGVLFQLTGAILVLELTSSFNLILPMLITCLGATLVAQLLGGRPLYTVLLEKKLAKDQPQVANDTALAKQQQA